MWFKSLLIFTGLAIASVQVEASVVTINIGGSEFSSSGANDIVNDAVVLTFTDGLTNSGTGEKYVRLEIFFKGDGGVTVDANSKLGRLEFNVAGTLTAAWCDESSTDDTPGEVSDTRAKYDAPDALSQYYDPNSFGQGPARGFDIRLDFPRSNKADFEVGFRVYYDLYGTGSGTDGELLATDFETLNDPSNSDSSDLYYYATAQLLSVDDGDSGRYGGGGPGGDGDPVPEPGTIAIWSVIGLGAVGGAAWRRRKNSKVA